MPLEKALQHPVVQATLVFAVALSLQWIAGRTTRKLAKEHFMAEATSRRLRSAIRLTIFFVALFVGLQVTGAMGHAWAIVSAALAALAVGFVATWSLLSNVTGALVLLGMRPFRIGDEIEIHDGDKLAAKGEVLDLNLFFTTLGHDDAVSRIPNSLMLQRVIRVMRQGTAPDPSQDGTEPFYSTSSNPKVSLAGEKER